MSGPTMTQIAPYPYALEEAVDELRYLPGWVINLTDEDRGQGCRGLTLNIYPDKPDSYHPENHVRTRFLYPVPAASFNRESWEEWLWARIEETEGHERAEWFRFVGGADHEFQGAHVSEPCLDCDRPWREHLGQGERRPFKPAHPDGWDPGVVRTVVSETVVNTPNAGRLVEFPCACGHLHKGRMGEHFRIESALRCHDCNCELRHDGS